MLSLMVGLLPFPGYPLAVPPFPLKPEETLTTTVRDMEGNTTIGR
jgi:hypothetical protein